MIEELKINYREALASKNMKLRLEFIQSLLKCQSEECTEFHLYLIRDKRDVKFYNMIRSSLQKRGDTIAPVLINIIKTSTDDELRSDAIRTLGNLRYHSSILLIENFIDSDKKEIRYSSIISLGWMGGKEQIDLLLNQYKIEKDPLLRGYTITALRQIFFNHGHLNEYIINEIRVNCLTEENDLTRECIIVSIQTIADQNLGLRENIHTGAVTGDIQRAWQRLKSFFEQLA